MTEFPGLASVASQIEMFHMPMREIRKRYTKSEVVLIGWRSSEIAYNMQTRLASGRDTPRIEDPAFQSRLDAIEANLGDMVGRLENEEGDIDLRQVTGEEALKFMSTIGIPLGRV